MALQLKAEMLFIPRETETQEKDTKTGPHVYKKQPNLVFLRNRKIGRRVWYSRESMHKAWAPPPAPHNP